MTPTALATLLLTALLAVLPRVPEPMHSRIEIRRAAIEEALAKGEELDGVPVGVFAVVGMLESHLGTAPRSGGCFGAPIDIRHRGTAGTARHATRALARSYVVCGSWTGAIGRFRSGLCNPTNPVHRAYVARAVRLIEATYARAGVSLPARMR